MKYNNQIILAYEPPTIFATYAAWILFPTAIALVCTIWIGGALHRIWIVPVISSLIFLGSFVSHFRARKGLAASADGLSWTVPNTWEFLGGVAHYQIQWRQITSCRAVRIQSRSFNRYSFDGLEVTLQASVSLFDDSASADTCTTSKANVMIRVGDESWTWTEDGKTFLGECDHPEGWKTWSREKLGPSRGTSNSRTAI